MSSDHYDPSCDLSVQDIVVNSITNLNTLQVHIEGPTWVGTMSPSVPHLPSLGHADIPGGEGFKPDLYFAKDGSAFIRHQPVAQLGATLTAIGVECSRYPGHSFRGGGGGGGRRQQQWRRV